MNNFAQEILDNMTLTGANPSLQEAFVREIDAEVEAADTGYANRIEKMASATV
ncbi:hypothetical protein D3C78_1978890 [compost metagenome]